MADKKQRSREGSVFVLTLSGVEILYLAGANEIVSRVQPKQPKLPVPVPGRAERRNP